MSDISYEDRVKAQIAQYVNTMNIQELPAIFSVWSVDFISPGLREIFGTHSIDECYARAYIEAREREGCGRILSVGCGDGTVEIGIAKLLLERGIDDFTFVCADLSPILLNRFRAALQREQLGSFLTPIEADLNKINVPGEFSVIMANHSLHHIVGLEQLFAYSKQRLREGGIFATCDMIGRNGHMRWPETEAVLQAIWPLLDPKQRYQIQLQRYEERYINHDCSTVGFEGIRAQDILPLLLETFHPYRFMAAGGFVDLVVDRGYGHAFDPGCDRDVNMIRFLGSLNDMMLDAGMVKPTLMMAWFTKDKRGEFFYRDRRARFCVRQPGYRPDWTRFGNL